MVAEIHNAAVFPRRIPARPNSRGHASAGRCCLPPPQILRNGRKKRGVSPPSPSSPTFSARTGLQLGFKVATGAEEGPRGRAAAGTRCLRRPRARHPDLPQRGLEPGCGCASPAAPRLGLELRLPRPCLCKQRRWRASRGLRNGAGDAKMQPGPPPRSSSP